MVGISGSVRMTKGGLVTDESEIREVWLSSSCLWEAAIHTLEESWNENRQLS